MIVTFPVGLLVDDSGALLTAPVVTVTSVTDKAGSNISSPGTSVNGSGTSTPISIDYDAETHGEAWITFSVSQSGHTVTNSNATQTIYAAKDSSRIVTALPNAAVPTDSSIQTDVTTALGTGSGLTALATASALATVETHAASADSQSAAAVTTLALLQGLLGHNQGVRNQVYDGNGNLTSADICSYDTASHATTNDGATGLAHKWALTLTYSGAVQQTQSIAAVS